MPAPLNQFKFSLNSTLQGLVSIDDPIGWEDLTIQGNRDSNTHGLFFDISGTTFKFWGTAYDYLMTAFDTDGIEANVSVIIEETCDGGITYSDFFTGLLDFTKKEQIIGMPCLFVAPVTQDGLLVNLKTKIDQKVEIPTTSNISIPTKTILKYAQIFQEGADTVNEETYTHQIDDDADAYMYMKSFILLYGNGLKQDDPFEINNYPQLIDVGNCWDRTNPYTCSNAIGFDGNSQAVGTPLFVAPSNGSYNIKWDISVLATIRAVLSNTAATHGAGLIGGGTCISADGNPAGFEDAILHMAFKIDSEIPANNAYTFINQDIISGCFNRSEDYLLSLHEVNPGFNVVLNQGDRVSLFFQIVHGAYYFAGTSSYGGTGAYNVTLSQKIEIQTTSYFNVILNDNASYPTTTAATSFVDSAFQTAVKGITNNAIDFKSLFFGRTDGINGGESSDGCGGLNVLTNGLKLRQITSKLFLSPKYLFDNLSAIYNLGMGVEIISGNYFLRVEDVRYFYGSGVSLLFNDIPDIKAKFDSSLAANKLSVGYSTWESEGASGLDDIMTKREYSIPLNSVKGDLTKHSDIIASSYSAEVTRRKGIESKDFKYDNNTFIFLLKRSGGGYAVDKGNISSPLNLIDYASGYNYNISPARNAMRWFKTAFVAVKDYLTASMSFKYGEGNYTAQGLLTSGCSIEANRVDENENIEYSDMDSGEGTPLFSGELIEFEAPLTGAQLSIIQASPYEKIGVSSGTTGHIYGWIKSISYKKKEKKAKFVLLKEI